MDASEPGSELPREPAELRALLAELGRVPEPLCRHVGREAAADGADLPALGATLFELSTGEPLSPGAPRPAGEANSQLSPFFEELLAALLAPDGFRSAAEVRDVLDAGEESDWWRERAAAIRRETGRTLRRPRVRRESPLEGRDEELGALREEYAAARAGDGRVVLVEGEAGVGKSRLLDEFATGVAGEAPDARFLFGAYPPTGPPTATGAFSTAYREHLGEEGLDATLTRLLPDSPELVPALASLLRGEAPPQGRPPLTRESIHAVFFALTRRLTETSPVVLLLEDLHFAPEEGRALFSELARAAPGHRLLLLGSFRGEVPRDWVRELTDLPHVTRRILPPAGPGPGDFRRRLAELEERDRRLLDIACCAGAEFDARLVGAVARVGEVPLLLRLGRIESRTRLVHALGRRFVFDHPLVQEALYEELPHLVREQHHAGLGEELERRTGAAGREPSAIPGALCHALCHHFSLGRQGHRGRRYLDRALDHLENGHLNHAAVRMAEWALAVAGLLEGSERVHVLLRQAGRLAILGRRAEEDHALGEARRIADLLGHELQRAEVRIRLARLCRARGEPDAARDWLFRARDLVSEAGDYDQARRLHEEALAVDRDLPDGEEA